MNYKEKLETIIEEFNSLLSDSILFPECRGGKFNLFIKEVGGIYIAVFFAEGNKELPIYIIKNTTGGELIYKQAYFGVFKWALLTEDSISKRVFKMKLKVITNYSLNSYQSLSI